MISYNLDITKIRFENLAAILNSRTLYLHLLKSEFSQKLSEASQKLTEIENQKTFLQTEISVNKTEYSKLEASSLDLKSSLAELILHKDTLEKDLNDLKNVKCIFLHFENISF